jgi:hypothetical protein
MKYVHLERVRRGRDRGRDKDNAESAKVRRRKQIAQGRDGDNTGTLSLLRGAEERLLEEKLG